MTAKAHEEQLPRFKAAPDCKVRKLDGAPIADDGEELATLSADGSALSIHPYYARLIADGDLVAADETATSGSAS